MRAALPPDTFASGLPNRRVIPFRRPLTGRLQTALGVWTVTVLKDQQDRRTRRFTLSLLAPNVRHEDAVTFTVRVPVTVIQDERPETWATDLREDLAYWISTNVIERGEIVWFPIPPADLSARP